MMFRASRHEQRARGPVPHGRVVVAQQGRGPRGNAQVRQGRGGGEAIGHIGAREILFEPSLNAPITRAGEREPSLRADGGPRLGERLEGFDGGLGVGDA